MSVGIALVALCTFAIMHPHASPDSVLLSDAEESAPDVDAQLIGVIKTAVEAQAKFDPAALARVLSPDYIEVSPVGEVDRREAVLGFYDPSHRRPAPVVTVTEPLTHVDGSVATAIVLLAFSPPGDAGTRAPMRMRATYVMRRQSVGWMIASAQFTPVRPAGR